MLDLLFKLVDGGYFVGFDKRAIMGPACELFAAGGHVVIARAVRSCGELLEELKVRECSKIDSCCFVVLVASMWKHLWQTLPVTYILAQVELPRYRRERGRWPQPICKDKYMAL